MKNKKILIACEESQVVLSAFVELGFTNVWSCDLIDTSGKYPEKHLKMDVMELIKNERWDLIIAFPPCTYLCCSGNRWFNIDKYGQAALDRIKNRHDAILFFMNIVNANADHIAIENPIGIMSSVYRKPDQIIHPWQFGHGEKKSTCLWLKNLPKLVPTNIVDGREEKIFKMAPSPERSKLRSKTYLGVGKAMAEQWGNFLINER